MQSVIPVFGVTDFFVYITLNNKANPMDWINIIIAAICSLIGALGGGSLLYFRQNKRSKDVENELKEADEWKKLYQEKAEKSNAKDAKIDELRRHINALQQDKIALIEKSTQQQLEKDKEIAKLQLLLFEEKYYRCEVAGCGKRKPPRKMETDPPIE